MPGDDPFDEAYKDNLPCYLPAHFPKTHGDGKARSRQQCRCPVEAGLLSNGLQWQSQSGFGLSQQSPLLTAQHEGFREKYQLYPMIGRAEMRLLSGLLLVAYILSHYPAN